MNLKFRQFQNNICVCLTIRQTTSGTPIDDLTVASCASFTFRKKTAQPNSGQKFLVSQKPYSVLVASVNHNKNMILIAAVIN